MTIALPPAVTYADAALRTALRDRDLEPQKNNVIQFIIVIAIVVLLLLAASIVAAAIILCAQHGGVLDTVVRLDQWSVKVKCHKI